jgi:pilus assembly protein CpaE
MTAYLVNSGNDTKQADALATQLREILPEVKEVDALDAVPPAARGARSIVFVVETADGDGAVDRVIDYAGRPDADTYCVYVAGDLDALDYKRLLKTGNAEWVPAEQASSELPDVVSRWLMRIDAEARGEGHGSTVFSLLPSGGGVGNTTILIELAVWLARHREREARVCVVDLNFQDGNVCDLLNVDPRFDIMELSQNPGRLDDHMLEIFTTRHNSGFDVLAAPKLFADYATINPDAIYAVFNALNSRYDYVLSDFPHVWISWTDNILRNSDAVLLTGSYTVPSALRMSAARKKIESISVPSESVITVVNEYETSLFSSSFSRSDFEESVGEGGIFYIPRDDKFVTESANLGEPMMTIKKNRRICREIAKLGEHVAGAKARARSRGTLLSR